jgi:hypothetical protein
MPRDYDDKPKRSWREIDKNKDSSKHRQQDRKPMSPHKTARAESASKVYKSKLDAFFSGDGKVPAHVKEKVDALQTASSEGKARTSAIKAIKDANTSSAADKAVAAYLEKWELPPDFEVLSQVLTCSDEDYILDAMEIMKKIIKENRLPRRVQLLEQRLRRVKTLAEDPDLQEKADQLIKKLRLFS